MNNDGISPYEAVIGLEVHLQLSTLSKAFCSCEVSANSSENTKVCEICLGHPGTLPRVNKKAVDYAILLGLATESKINQYSLFSRKNYFYPDLVKGYQITQFGKTIAENGHIAIMDDAGVIKKISIDRIQLEEDTGKSTHDGKNSLLNFNRSSIPLLEVISKAEMRTSKEAYKYLKELHQMLLYLKISHGNLQDGNFRCDVNLSLRGWGTKVFGIRTEAKNINSFRNVEKYIDLEILRQTEILEKGGTVLQETLSFDALDNKITPMRVKSDATDYRYFPEPDLLPLVISNERIKALKESLPELGASKRERFVNTYKLPSYDTFILTETRELADYFEEVACKYKGEAKRVSNWIMVELLKLLNEFSLPIGKSPVPAEEIAALLSSVDDGTLSSKMAKTVFQKMFDEKKSAKDVIASMNLVQISDEKSLYALAEEIVSTRMDKVKEYHSGRDRLLGLFIGELMKMTKGAANPKMADKIMHEVLDKKRSE